MTRKEIRDYSREIYGMLWPPDYDLEVPCGYCHSCQKSVNNQYRIRLLYECRRPLSPGRINLFVTLTFNDDYLEKFADDPNRAVRLFLDRMRKRYGKQVRHWFIGEYGTLNGRPHYHGILFCVPSEIANSPYGPHTGQNLELESVWQYGFIYCGYVCDETCSYITKYLTKSLNGDKVRPRVISSLGIGDNYLSTDEAKMHKMSDLEYQPFMLLNGFKQAMPRYYYNKIFSKVDHQNIVLDRYLNPPDEFHLGPLSFKVRKSFVSARRALYSTNVMQGLTPSVAPPTRKRKARKSILTEIENKEF